MALTMAIVVIAVRLFIMIIARLAPLPFFLLFLTVCVVLRFLFLRNLLSFVFSFFLIPRTSCGLLPSARPRQGSSMNSGFAFASLPGRFPARNPAFIPRAR